LELNEKGVITSSMCRDWLSDYEAIMADDAVPQAVWLETPRPISHMMIAHSIFCQRVGETPEAHLASIRARSSRSTANKIKTHSALYAALLKSEEADAAEDLKRRFIDKGWDPAPILQNLAKIPFCIPQSHRITFMKFLLNGLPTTRRMRHVSHGPVDPCHFCSAQAADCIDHWFECDVLRSIYPSLHVDADRVPLHHDVYHLLVPLEGRQLQILFALVHALWRCRCAGARGLSFASQEDLVTHMRTLIEDPWLRCASEQRTKKQRRADRAIPPNMPFGCCIFNCDGASRKRQAERNASAAAVLWINGAMYARHGDYLGDATNNEAEYAAALLALRHILTLKCCRNYVRLDSLLVTRQLRGEWACKAPHLQRDYEEGMRLISLIRRCPEITFFEISHIYREFNADADSVANEAIDTAMQRNIQHGIVISHNWSLHAITEPLISTLRDPTHGHRDVEGNINMQDAPSL